MYIFLTCFRVTLPKKSQVQRKIALIESLIREKIDITRAALNKSIGLPSSLGANLQPDISTEPVKVIL
jgi:hypothetical protein